tara:strand:- start:4890 stop:5297 length:408 start_codon:yes stop_codon:yes gene_type:complete
VRRRKGVAVELGIDADGAHLAAQKKRRTEHGKVPQSPHRAGCYTRVYIAWACLVDDAEFAYVHVHVGLYSQLPHCLEDGQARRHWPGAPRTNESPCVKDEDATARIVESQLDCGKALWRKVGVGAPRSYGVQVER